MAGGGERGGLLGDAGAVEHGLGVEDGLLGGLEDGVHAAEDAHGEDDVWVFAALEKIAEDIVGDAPEEGDDLFVGGLIHGERQVARNGARVGGRNGAIRDGEQMDKDQGSRSKETPPCPGGASSEQDQCSLADKPDGGW